MARTPLSLSAYLTLARGRDRTTTGSSDWPHRPDGAVIWLHADTRTRLESLLTLVRRLQSHRGRLSIVLSCDAFDSQQDTGPAVFAGPPPFEVQRDIQRFLEHWRPQIVIWAGNGLRPALLHETARRGTHMLLVDAADSAWRQPSQRWAPDATAAALQLFHAILAQNGDAAQRLRRLGVPEARIEVASPLEPDVIPLPDNAGLREEMSEAFAGRPVWLAAGLHLDEAEPVLRAHRRAARLAHRLLLITVPDMPGEDQPMIEIAQEIGLRVARWDNGEMPDENTQVLVAGGPGELGLWYRLAPLCFLGGSLSVGRGGQSPMMAAALGSAILYGPQVGSHLETYSRLVAAGAARIVKDMESLSAAVSHLIAPDRAAAMAHAGWNVVSAGAETADLIVTQIEDWLDALETPA